MIERPDLINRLLSSQARIIRLTAPAGYGKSTLARALAQRFDASAVCACEGVDGVAAFAHLLIAALAQEDLTRAEPLAQQELSAGGDEHALANVLSHAWRSPGPQSLLVLENAEQLAEQIAALALLTDLLATSHLKRTIAICSRVALPVQFSRTAAPHEMAELGIPDLRLGSDEVRRIFAELAVSDDALRRVYELSRGWAIAVFLLARFAREGRLEATLDKIDDVAFGDLHEYLASEVLASLPAAQFDALLVCAAIPRASAADIERAIGSIEAETLHKELARLPFVSRVPGDVYEVDPLMATTLRSRHSARCRSIVARTAEAWLRDQNYVRAAKLYLALGNREAAADAIERAEAAFLTAPSIEFADVVAGLDERTMASHPQIWGAAMIWRSQSIEPHEWMRQAHAIWLTLPRTASQTLRGSIAGAYFSALTNLGRVTEADRLLFDFEQQLGPTDATGQAVVDLLRLNLDVLVRGKYSALELAAPRLHAMLLGSDVSNAYFLSQLAGYAHTARGEFDQARLVFERAVELVMRTNVPQAKAMVLSHAATFEWIAGDDRAFEERLSTLEQLIEPSIAKAYAFFLDCARGRLTGSHVGFEKLERRTIAYLMAAGSVSAVGDATRYARLAVEAADESSQPFLQVLARAALGELVSAERRKLLKRAADLAAQVESKPLQDAVTALRDGAGHFGMLAPLVARFRKRPVAAGDAARLVPSVSELSPLSKREREVAALIAQGKSNREIGAILVISERTVENHVASMFNKLGIGSRAALAAYVASRRED